MGTNHFSRKHYVVVESFSKYIRSKKKGYKTKRVFSETRHFFFSPDFLGRDYSVLAPRVRQSSRPLLVPLPMQLVVGEERGEIPTAERELGSPDHTRHDRSNLIASKVSFRKRAEREGEEEGVASRGGG